MKLRRLFLIVLLLSSAVYQFADDYVDDIYYKPKQELQLKLTQNRPLTPYYNKNVKEIVFIDDTLSDSHPDTVRAIIRYSNVGQ